MTEGASIIAANPPWARHRIFATALLCALGVEVYLLLHDVPLFSTGESARPIAPPIAELTSHRNTIRIQNDGSLIWEDPRDGDTLFRRQSVLTLDASKAEIRFLDGSGIVVDENSLIQLEKNPGDDSLGYRKLVIRLLRGTIHKVQPRGTPLLARKVSETLPELEIQAGGSSAIVPAGAELSVTATPESVRIKVHQGAVQVQSASGELSIREGEVAALSKDSSKLLPSTRKAALNLLAPLAGENLGPERAASVHFTWKNDLSSLGGAPLDLEVSTDPKFKTDVKSLRISATEPPLEKIDADLALPAASTPVQWFWRVKNVNDESITSDTRNFWILPKPVSVSKFPPTGASVASEKPVQLLWKPVDGAQGYEVEVDSAQPAGPKTIFTRDVYGKVEKLPPGNTKWRVRAKLVDGSFGPWSEPAALKVLAPGEKAAVPVTREVPLPPPPDELSDPEVLEKTPAPRHSWLDLLIARAFAEEPLQWKLLLKWKAVNGVTKYRVQIATTRDFKRVLEESDVASPQVVWTYRAGMENTKGRVFYRVASMTADGRVGRFSGPKPVPIPKSVLAEITKARKKPEIYDAVEAEEGPSTPADAAPASDLQTALNERPEPKAPTPSRTPQPIASPIPEEQVTKREASRAAERQAEEAALKPASEKPGPSATSEAAAERPALNQLSFAAGIFGGIGNFHQSGTDSSLSSVSMQSLYPRQSVGLGAALVRATENETPVRYTASLRYSSAKYGASVADRPVIQPDVKASEIDAEVMRWADSAAWKLAAGIALADSFRWVKSAPQSVDSASAISFGPAAYAVRNYTHEAGWLPQQLGAGFALPLSGALGDSFYGASGKFWGEWKLTQSLTWIGLRIEGDSAYQRWKSPVGTSTLTWTAWIAPVIHFDSGTSDWPSPSP